MMARVLTDEEIAQCYRHAFNMAPDRRREAPNPTPPVVFSFARMIIAAQAALNQEETNGDGTRRSNPKG